MTGRRALLAAAVAAALLGGAAAAASLLAHEGELSVPALRRWAAGAIRPPGVDLHAGAEGPEGLVATYGCLNCHALRGAGARVGPALDGVRARKTRAELLLWLEDPQAIRPGTPMPDFNLDPDQRRVLADWLLRQ